jgi:hypothetical protein
MKITGIQKMRWLEISLFANAIINSNFSIHVKSQHFDLLVKTLSLLSARPPPLVESFVAL